MKLPAEVIEDLIVALLAVNSYPMERVAKILPTLRNLQLTVPTFVSATDENELTKLLNEAGYSRGYLIGMFAERLKSLMKEISNGNLDEIVSAISNHDRSAIATCLRDIKGVGPKVIQNACILLFSKTTPN